MNGREALEEAARLETARVYGNVHSSRRHLSLVAARAENEIEATLIRRIEEFIIDGCTTSQIMDATGASYTLIQQVRAGEY